MNVATKFNSNAKEEGLIISHLVSIKFVFLLELIVFLPNELQKVSERTRH